MTNEVYKQSLEALQFDLNNTINAKEQLAHQISLYTDFENKLKKAIDSLKAITEGDNYESEDLNMPEVTFKWKQMAYEFLCNNKEVKFTSPDIFDSIYKASKTLTNDARRKKMINLSISLSSLVAENKIEMTRNEGKRGYQYFVKNYVSETDNKALDDFLNF